MSRFHLFWFFSLLRKWKYFKSIFSIEVLIAEDPVLSVSFPKSFGPWGLLGPQLKGLNLWQRDTDRLWDDLEGQKSGPSFCKAVYHWKSAAELSILKSQCLHPTQRASLNTMLSGIRKNSKISHCVIQIFLSGHWNTLLLATRLHSSTLFAALWNTRSFLAQALWIETGIFYKVFFSYPPLLPPLKTTPSLPVQEGSLSGNSLPMIPIALEGTWWPLPSLQKHLPVYLEATWSPPPATLPGII